MVQPRPKLLIAIERLYAAFVPYSLKPDFPARCSPFSDRRDIARRLQSAPLRLAGAADLANYAFKARYTMGDGDDFKHFLPRMLELYASEPEWWGHQAGEATLFEDIRDLGWHEWPVGEREAVHGYIEALWRGMVAGDSSPVCTGDLCQGLCVLGTDFGQLLSEVRPVRSAEGLRWLAEFVLHYMGNNYGTAASQIDDWLAANEVREVLEEGYFHYQGQPFVDDLARAADWLFSRRA